MQQIRFGSWPTRFPLMFGVQYLNYHQIPASYREGGASDFHSVTLTEIQNHALTKVQNLQLGKKKLSRVKSFT